MAEQVGVLKGDIKVVDRLSLSLAEIAAAFQQLGQSGLLVNEAMKYFSESIVVAADNRKTTRRKGAAVLPRHQTSTPPPPKRGIVFGEVPRADV